MDDYAHHPQKLPPRLEQHEKDGTGGSLRCFSLTAIPELSAYERFCCSFDDADLVVLTTFTHLPEKAIPGISSAMLADKIRERGRPVVSVVPKQQDVAAFLDGCVQPGIW